MVTAQFEIQIKVRGRVKRFSATPVTRVDTKRVGILRILRLWENVWRAWDFKWETAEGYNCVCGVMVSFALGGQCSTNYGNMFTRFCRLASLIRYDESWFIDICQLY